MLPPPNSQAAITKGPVERRKYHRREPENHVRRRPVYRVYCFFRSTAELACTNKHLGYRIKPAATQNGFMRARAISTCSALLSVALLTAWPKSLLALAIEGNKAGLRLNIQTNLPQARQ